MQLVVCPWEISGGTSGGCGSRCPARIILTWISFHSNPPPGGGHLFSAISVSLCASECTYTVTGTCARAYMWDMCVCLWDCMQTRFCACVQVHSVTIQIGLTHTDPEKSLTWLPVLTLAYRCVVTIMHLQIIHLLAKHFVIHILLRTTQPRSASGWRILTHIIITWDQCLSHSADGINKGSTFPDH